MATFMRDNNITFCSKSENKAPRILIFGVNILYSIPNRCT